MAYCLLCLTSFVLSLISISSGESYRNMCESKSKSVNDYKLELGALESSISGLTAGLSMTCSCSISVTPSSNEVSVHFSRVSRQASACENYDFDKATLNYSSKTNVRSRPLEHEELSDYYKRYDNILTMSFDVTIYSTCGSNYTIDLQVWLKESSRSNDDAKFSNVTCWISNVFTSSVTTTSSTTRRPAAASSTARISTSTSSAAHKSAATLPTVGKLTKTSQNAFRPTNTTKNDIMSSTNASNESNNAGSVVEKDTSGPSKKGLIAGVVVGVGVGLFILGAVILAVFIYRRRRAKPQPPTFANNNAPTGSSYESLAANVPISYEDFRSSNEFPPSSTYDNQTATTDSLTTETNRNYYSVQGIDNSALHPSNAASYSDRASSEGADSSSQEPHSENDAETTVIENDLYEK